MKKAIVLLTVLVCLLSLIGCSAQTPKKPEKPETDLEFWIAENVDDFDFSGWEERYGIMGGREYYGSGYVPTKDENGEQIDPAECVIYTVTSYPDYSDKEQHITRITITDPTVKIVRVRLVQIHILVDKVEQIIAVRLGRISEVDDGNLVSVELFGDLSVMAVEVAFRSVCSSV